MATVERGELLPELLGRLTQSATGRDRRSTHCRVVRIRLTRERSRRDTRAIVHASQRIRTPGEATRDPRRPTAGPRSSTLCARRGDGPTYPHDEGRRAAARCSPASSTMSGPATSGEALRILTDREGEAKVLSGGYSLIPLMKLRLAQPGLLVDIGHVAGLDGIVETDDELRIGARATHCQIHESDIIARYPLLHDASGGIGDPQVRNWGTIGGSVAHADPASDWPAVLQAAKAMIVCRSATGERVIAAKDFFVDTFQTAIEPTEILTEIRFRRRRGGRVAPTSSSSARSATTRRSAWPPSRGWRAAASGGPASGSPAPRTARTPPRMRKRSSPATLHRTICSDVPARWRPRRHAPRPTFGDPSTTSGPWSPSSRSGHSARRSSAVSRIRRRSR